MNWLHFTCWVTGLYLLYYLALIFFDASRSRGSKTAENGELTFSEDILPKKIEHLPDKTEKSATKNNKTRIPGDRIRWRFPQKPVWPLPGGGHHLYTSRKFLA